MAFLHVVNLQGLVNFFWAERGLVCGVCRRRRGRRWNLSESLDLLWNVLLERLLELLILNLIWLVGLRHNLIGRINGLWVVGLGDETRVAYWDQGL